jgi:hypothetical protein
MNTADFHNYGPFTLTEAIKANIRAQYGEYGETVIKSIRKGWNVADYIGHDMVLDRGGDWGFLVGQDGIVSVWREGVQDLEAVA